MIRQSLTPDEWLRQADKPPIVTGNVLEIGERDVLIVCAGFEDRATAFLSVALSVRRSFNVVVVEYEPTVEHNRTSRFYEMCSRSDLTVTRHVYDRTNPIGFGDLIVSSLAGCERVFIDISAMSRLLIVQLLVAIHEHDRGFQGVSVLYAEAEHYPPTFQEAAIQIEKARVDPRFAVLFLSAGVYDVTVLPELGSIAPPGDQTRMVCFPSMAADQLTAVRSEIHPSRIVFIEGTPPSEENSWRQTAIAKINGLDDIPNAERVAVSTLDYRDNLDVLLRVYGERPERERILICPTGSKMQTLAVGIFRAFMRDVQIIYPTPKEYVNPTAYTVGVGALHRIDLEGYSTESATRFAPISE